MTDGEGNLQAIFGVAISDYPADMLVIYTGAGLARLVIDEEITGNVCARPSPLS
jgi:hypothetical protein